MQGAGVIFDMDGVLADSSDAHYRSWVALGTELGKPVAFKQFAATFGRTNRDIIPLLFGAADEDQLAAWSNRKEELYRESIRARPPIAPGAVELIAALHRAGFRLAIGSSGPRENIELIVGALGASGLFSAIVAGEDVARGKPDPEVFLKAAGRLGLPANRCIVIEDAPAGVVAARRAGAMVVAVLSTHGADAFPGGDDPRAPHTVVRSLRELDVGVLRSLL